MTIWLFSALATALQEQRLEPDSTFRRRLNDFDATRPQAPMNESARLAAGFTQRELAGLLKIE